MASDGGSSSHSGTDQVGASTLALPSLEVAVAGGGTALPLGKLIPIHGDTHAASRLAPLKACLAEDVGDALLFGQASHLRGAWHDHGADVWGDLLALYIHRSQA